MLKKIRRGGTFAVAIAVLASAAAGCGSSSGGNSQSSAGSGNSADQAAAERAVATAQKPPSAWAGPKTGPKASPGKRVAIISCSQASNCAVGATASVEAAKALGWKATVFDGKGDPARYNAALRNAANSGFDGIITIAIPTDLVQDGLRYVKQRKVPVINSANVQSTDPLVYGNVPHQWAEQGDQLGEWIVSDSGGKAGVLIFRDDEFPGIKVRQDRVEQQLKKCPGCEVLGTVKLTIAQATDPSAMAQQTQSAIAKYGNKLKYIVAPFGTVDGLIVPALRSRNRTDIKVAGYDGNEQQTALCKEGAVGAIAVTMLAWTGWGAIDQVNRALAGAKPANENVPAYLATEKTCPGKGLAEQTSTFDFRAAYKKLWSTGRL